MEINLKLATQLQQLSEGESLTFKSFSAKNLIFIKQLINDGLLYDNKIVRRKKVVSCPNADKLEKHLFAKYEIYGLKNYINVLQNPNSTKSDMVNVSGDEKLRTNTSLDGFLLKAYENINGKINNETINLKTTNGTSLHINNWQSFEIDDIATIVVVENSENFKLIHKQKDLFSNIKPVFLLRFANSTAISKWITQTKNNYLHFGDFDLKGVHIYITEFKQRINNSLRCKYYIPDNIEKLIYDNGNSKRYYEQKQNLKNFNFSAHSEIINLINIIEKHKKGLDQEYLITNR
ncbi:MAG: hypothetical protein U9Q83_11435 [Bacteroidota bacterium]|nr:hypothetical protein [Bacteroidota bacterium]